MGLRVGSNPPQENVASRLSKFEPRGEEIWSEYEGCVERFEIK
jgi:hypothetical protein